MAWTAGSRLLSTPSLTLFYIPRSYYINVRIILSLNIERQNNADLNVMNEKYRIA